MDRRAKEEVEAIIESMRGQGHVLSVAVLDGLVRSFEELEAQWAQRGAQLATANAEIGRLREENRTIAARLRASYDQHLQAAERENARVRRQIAAAIEVYDQIAALLGSRRAELFGAPPRDGTEDV